MKCHFVVNHVDDNRDSRHHKRDSVDTGKNPKDVAGRIIRLLLYKNHYMIDKHETLPTTKYYIEHRNEHDEKYPTSVRYMIKNKGGELSDKGTRLLTVLKFMFANGLFRAIKQCEQCIHSTCEFDSNLNDNVDLS